MDRPRVIRWLRITASAACLIACVAFSVLWVRSFQKNTKNYRLYGDRVSYLDSHMRLLGIWSEGGAITLSVTNRELGSRGGWLTYGAETRIFGFGANTKGGSKSVRIPHWFLVLLSATLAYVPWLPWWSPRFSLRTMLIVTTVVAIVLGLVVAFAR